MSLFGRIFGRKKKEEEAEHVHVPEHEHEHVDGGPEVILEGFVQATVIPDLPAIESAVLSLVASGRTLRAVDLLRRVSAAHGDPPELARRTALLLVERGDDDAAAPLFERAASEAALAKDALFQLAEIHERAGRAARALECYERVLARDFDYPNARERALRLARAVRPAATTAAPTLFSPEGAKVQGRFQLLRELGRGGAGAVYLARDARLGRTVALKVYHPARSGEGDPDRRLLHEAKVAAAIRHPGVIRILDVVPEMRAIVMESLAASVKDRVREGLAPDAVRAMAQGALEVAVLLHGRGIVHRDLKTSNLLVRDDGRVVVTDFGVALVGDRDEEIGVVGTAGYIAPEVAGGARATPAADVYALGVILREIAGAGSPFAAVADAMCASDPEARPDALGALERLENLG